MNYSFKTKGVCASLIKFDINDGKIYNVEFTGGCNGNLKAISKLVEGMECNKVIELLKGNTCGWKNTSCSDQLTKAIELALNESGM
ncbi:MAG: TIGR03905 family TSCPD domain-containing protein [Clostridia bacterium]|nr:TIGR03905 family TSCPD domain-containing protein [Clostridia bacterium]